MMDKDLFKPIPIKDQIRYKRNHISANITVVTFKDGEYHIAYAPSLEMSGYGNTEDEAKEMFAFSIKDLFETLSKRSVKIFEEEMKKYGFKKEQYSNKKFSKMYVDANGVLNGLSQPKLKKEDVKIEQIDLV